jgi:hypothetical protein
VGTICHEVVNGRVIAVVLGCAVMSGPSAALAQNGFPDFRQAAADQYPAQPPPGASGSSGGESQTGGSSGSPRPVTTSHGHKTTGHGRTNSGASAPSNAGGAAPVAVPTRPVPASKGSLPFTGSDLSGLVVLALVLIAAGLFLAAVARATRRRRRHAPA